MAGHPLGQCIGTVADVHSCIHVKVRGVAGLYNAVLDEMILYPDMDAVLPVTSDRAALHGLGTDVCQGY